MSTKGINTVKDTVENFNHALRMVHDKQDRIRSKVLFRQLISNQQVFLR